MKKILFSLLALLTISINAIPVSAAFTKSKNIETNEAIAKPETGLSSLSIEQILSLTPKNYERITGAKINFKDKLGLGYIQRNIKRDLKKNGTVNINDYVGEDGKTRFNIGGFLLGFLLGLIGVALAHIFSKDKSFRRSSWYGVGVILIIYVVLIAASAGK